MTTSNSRYPDPSEQEQRHPRMRMTQAQFDSLPQVDGVAVAPLADYRDIAVFGDQCHFEGSSLFAPGTRFGTRCRFGSNARFGRGCSFGNFCNFDRRARLGEACQFGTGCTFDFKCVFGPSCEFGNSCTFGLKTQFAPGARIRAGGGLGDLSYVEAPSWYQPSPLASWIKRTRPFVQTTAQSFKVSEDACAPVPIS